jgi:hypothetical protein
LNSTSFGSANLILNSGILYLIIFNNIMINLDGYFRD